jgi:hypothetical protein
MKKNVLYLFLLLVCFSHSAAFSYDTAFDDITINNRVLAKVNGKAISVLDIMKKMNVVFHKQYPHLVSTPAARYQFYTTNWKYVLKEMIDRQLVLDDAEEKKLPVSDGDIREEMEDLFGPNIIETVDKLGLSYEAAREMIHTDIIIRRMMMYRVQSRAMTRVHPKIIAQAYEDFVSSRSFHDTWSYNMITLRHKDPDKASFHANLAHHLLSNDNIPLDKLSSKLRMCIDSDSNIELSVSKELSHDDTTISSVHKDVLASLSDGAVSAPIKQISKATKEPVYRIFYLKKHTLGEPPAFAAIEEELKNSLLDKAFNEETHTYISSLYEYYGLTEETLFSDIPEDFEPFALAV